MYDIGLQKNALSEHADFALTGTKRLGPQSIPVVCIRSLASRSASYIAQTWRKDR